MIRAPLRSACLLTLAALLPAPLQAGERGDLVVSVAISLRPAVERVAAQYGTGERNGGIVLNAAASGVLMQQIRRGAGVDLFVSASPRELDRLEHDGLLDPGSRRDVASNRLVVLSPPAQRPPQTLDELAHAEFGLIAIGNPDTAPVGHYALQALVALGLEPRLRDRLVLAESALQVLAYVQRGEVAAGLAYRTDALRFGERVRIGPELPTHAHAPIVYQAAVLSAASRPGAARRFLDLLLSERGRAILTQQGFLPPP